jgi:fermentation-respiration switch protein FrsA (DUF1100 family)
LIEKSALFIGPEVDCKVPVLMMHGSDDHMVPLTWGEGTATSLLLAGVEVQTLEIYPTLQLFKEF